MFIGSGAFGNNFVGCIDRVRIHKEALTADDLDADPMSVRPLRTSTVVAYNFNETSMPFHSGKKPDRPLKSINSFLEEVSKPVFTTDTPSGLNPTGNLPFVGKLDRIRYTKGLLRPDQFDFWPIPGVEPAPPTLKTMTAVQLAWPTIPAGYKLQQTASLEEPIQWTDEPNAPLAMELNWNVFLPTSPQKMYYRLVKP
ncbi:MAG: hypothetical protein QHJ82_01880 [Verrucomicrobiota bacterium]|nr:hypothetical protein [Verrucomicrobiota bacterium]